MLRQYVPEGTTTLAEPVPLHHATGVGRIGVVPAARRRGLARYLLRLGFSRDAADGLDGTLLHVWMLKL